MWYSNKPVGEGFTGWLPGDFQQLDEGYVAIVKPNGKILSVQQNGTYEERDGVGGLFEMGKKTNKGNLMYLCNGVNHLVAVEE